jgi:hypothetical protein
MFTRFSILDDRDVSSSETSVTAKKAITFYPNVGSRLNFYKSLWRLFSLELLWNRYSVTERSRRAKLE